ncbi:hypothetical protein [Limosilactobacillus vaginalis]|uniref:hypothetical protein n=1 Tax=Limosilactobacillus vaginalis TaxID=1633 RepID=UPI000F51AA7C|nr:hypothetical protein [Limosilactobacillus vaginalis]
MDKEEFRKTILLAMAQGICDDDNLDKINQVKIVLHDVSENERAIDIKLTIPKTDPEITKPIVYDSKKPLMNTVSEALNSFGI